MPRFSSSSGRQTLVTLKQKKKSLADAVNEQLTASALGSGRDSGDGLEYTEGGVAEDYDFDGHNSGEDDDDRHDSFDAEDLNGNTRTGRTSAAAAPREKATKNGKKGRVATFSSSRLRHRGPLDASLSEGKYAATPVNVEAAMDDIFGALDMGDMDAEGEEFFDVNDDVTEGCTDDKDEGNEEGEAGAKSTREKESATRKRRRAKDLTEDEYAAWIEQRSEKEKKSGRLRRPLSFGGGGGANGVETGAMSNEEVNILRQLDELRQTQHVVLVPSADAGAAGDLGSSAIATTAAAAQSDAKSTRNTVQHFIMVYGQLLRLRVLLQPAVTRAISMPQYYARSFFLDPDPAVEKEIMATAANIEEGRCLVEELREQREAAAEKYEELQEGIEEVLATLYAATKVNSAKDNEHDEDEAVAYGSANAKTFAKSFKLEVPSYHAIEKYHQRVLRHAGTCLDYWGSKLVQANSAKLKTISQPLPQQIAAILAARSRLRTKVQKNRSHLAILAHPEHVRASNSAKVKAQRALHIAEGDVDAEIFDDADFLRELVRRGGAVANQLEQKVKDMQQALLPTREGTRKGFHRMTKGKAVNYEPRPKLVGFMMAESLDDTPRSDVVVKNLLQ